MKYPTLYGDEHRNLLNKNTSMIEQKEQCIVFGEQLCKFQHSVEEKQFSTNIKKNADE